MRASRNPSKTTFYLLAICLLAPTWAGCHSSRRGQRETALLRAEILDLEDQYYALKARCEQAESQLGNLPGVILDSSPTDSFGSEIFDGQIDVGTSAPLNPPCENCPPSDVIYEDPVVHEPPLTNRFLRAKPQSNRLARSRWFQNRRPLFGRNFNRFGGSGASNQSESAYQDIEVVIPDAHTTYDSGDMALNSIEVNSPQLDPAVAEVFVNPSVTHGENVDGTPGDEGIVVLVQPRSNQGQVIMAPGELTVSLIDPSVAGAKQRIGLWKFTPDEVKLFESGDESVEQGYLLHLPWDNNAPQSSQLMLFVRYRAPDGRKLETSKSLTIQPPAAGHPADESLISGWTKRDPKWNRGLDDTDTNIADRSIKENGSFENRTLGSGNGRGVPAIPASTTINRPQWRPTR